MRRILQINICMLFLIVGYGCGQQTQNKEADTKTTETTDQETTSSTPTEAVLLKGMYVTSTKIPESDFNAEYLLDGNKDTYWATMPGAGPDEGIMLYFESPQYISSLEILQPEQKNIAHISQVIIYVNGQDPLYQSAEGKIDINNESVQSLYIRIAEMDDMTSIDDPEAYLTSDYMDPDKSAAISELVLYDQSRMNIQAPEAIAGKVIASSTLTPERAYGIRNLFDARKEFAWVEGATGNGENEYFTVSLNQPTEISALKIFNGFQRSDKHFKANARLKKLEITSEAGDKAEASVKDTQGEQLVKFSKPVSGKKITFTIKETYPGTSYKDMVISELKMVHDGKDFIVKDQSTEKLKKELLSEVKGTILANYIDRRLYNEQNEMEGFKKSIILRSDYTFVVYDTNWDGDAYSEEMIADGNWEIKNLEQDEAKIRVFGKLTHISETIDYYAGNTETNKQQIFQDFLTITSQKISGDKFIPEIKNIQHHAQ